MKPTILTCAVTGSFPTREHNRSLPVTPAEIAGECVAAARAGAAMCHIHVRDPKTGAPSMELAYYREVVERIRASDTDLIINLTTGPGGRYFPSDDNPAVAAPGSSLTTPERRIEHVLALRPEVCSLDLNTMWFGSGAVINSPRNVRIMAEKIYAAGVKPELEVFDTGDIQLANDLIAEGALREPTLFQVVTGVKYGFSTGAEALLYAKSLLPAGCEWAAFGASRSAFPMVAQSVLLGGHCRIGMEDTVYLDRGVKTPGNAALVEKASRIIRDLGAQLATVAEARAILGLPAPA
ncbi:MAG: 3-keto-5-aminohexanoate cleavage protein [Gammaproteobacteria bacterium]|nr:3-keto-5-aminohexanoate cleavage protein [Gammaproteobacteria bacterium]MDH4255983.1 3-keto-5-aminohexanoate cleavage protein [Gammaproteobacteria bacterium]